MSDRARALSPSVAVVATLLALGAPSSAWAARWEVTFAVRLANGSGDPVSVRVALPPDTAVQRIESIDVSGRGFDTNVVREGDHPHVTMTGRLRDARRLAVNLVVDITPHVVTVPPIWPANQPPVALLPYLRPAPLFQSRSLLVREFLETNAAPLLDHGNLDPLRAIYSVTKDRLTRAEDGRSLALDVIRRGQGKRIGIERAFTTFLRCARIPARFVEGVRLSSSTHKKRTFWTEAWSEGQWWPVSASSGWIGDRPPSLLAMATDGTRVVSIDGNATASYTVRAQRLGKDAK